MKKIFITFFALASLASFAEEIEPPEARVTVKRLSAEGPYERSYRVSALRAFENEDGSVTLTMPYYAVGSYERYLRRTVSGNKLCKALNLGKKLSKRTMKITGGAGSPWALFSEGRELECVGCKVTIISELTCSK